MIFSYGTYLEIRIQHLLGKHSNIAGVIVTGDSLNFQHDSTETQVIRVSLKLEWQEK
jgi:hypothetical protein